MTNVGKPEFLARDNGARIAYRKTSGQTPGVVFFPGFRSDMQGGKALALEAMCREAGFAFLRFDYTGHGESSGDFAEGTIGAWLDDSLAVIDALTEGPQVLVGSSMGGWMMLLAALARPGRVAALAGVAVAPDFTQRLMWDRMPEEIREILRNEGIFHQPSEYDPEPTPITMKLIEEGRDHLILDDAIALDCPVRLIHGTADPDVPWEHSLAVAERLRSKDVEITLVKDAGHRLSEAHDLERLCRVVLRLCENTA